MFWRFLLKKKSFVSKFQSFKVSKFQIIQFKFVRESTALILIRIGLIFVVIWARKHIKFYLNTCNTSPPFFFLIQRVSKECSKSLSKSFSKKKRFLVKLPKYGLEVPCLHGFALHTTEKQCNIVHQSPLNAWMTQLVLEVSEAWLTANGFFLRWGGRGQGLWWLCVFSHCEGIGGEVEGPDGPDIKTKKIFF